MPPLSSNKAEPTLTLKPRGDITRSPKQVYQWAHKKVKNDLFFQQLGLLCEQTYFYILIHTNIITGIFKIS